jgi:hypothetical protein
MWRKPSPRPEAMRRTKLIALTGTVGLMALLVLSGLGVSAVVGAAGSAAARSPSAASRLGADLAVPAANVTLVNVTFQEHRLPNGSLWSVTAGNPAVTKNDTTVGAKGHIVFQEPNGSLLNYTITGPANYGVAKVVGTGVPSQTQDAIGGPTMISVTFAPIVTLTFDEVGLAPHTLWGITITTALPHGGPQSLSTTSNTSSLNFTVVKGTWKFNVTTLPAGYRAMPSHGAVGAGHAHAKTLRFKEVSGKAIFSESGLPHRSNWQVNLTGPVSLNMSSSKSTIKFDDLPVGTYTFAIWNFTGEHPTPAKGTFAISGPGAVDISITYSVAAGGPTLSVSAAPAAS